MTIKKNRKYRDIFNPEEGDSEGGSGVGGYTPFSDEKIGDIVPFIEARDQTLITLVEAKDEELTALMMEDEGKFGAVSKTRRKRKSRERRSGQRPDFPQHPLLDTQRFAGLSESDSPLASENVDAQEALLENLAGLVEQYPELRLNPALSNSLQARIDLYNKQQHVSAPEFKRN